MNIILYTDWYNIEKYKKCEEWTATTNKGAAGWNISVIVEPEQILQTVNDLCFLSGREI